MRVDKSIRRSVAEFLESQSNPRDLLNRYQEGMTLTVQPVAGEPVEGKRNVFVTNGHECWPIVLNEKNEGTKRMRYPLAVCAKEIGMTGRNHKTGHSHWVAFDFDALVGHAKGVGISDEQLSRINHAVRMIPWVEVRRSTRGTGLHLYVFFAKPVPTVDHKEHAALARSVLAEMSGLVGFDLATNVDACGSNMWVWSTRATAENQGLTVIKPATESMKAPPADWKAHLDVVTRRRTKVRVAGIDDEEAFDSLALQRASVPLDDGHRHFMDWAAKNGFTTIWVNDFGLLQCHTLAFKKYAEEHQIIGPFETVSDGNDPGQPNSFAFPLKNGGWAVYRFSVGCQEHPLWDQGDGWTQTTFNTLPDFDKLCLGLGATPDGDSYQFDSIKDAKTVLGYLGCDVEIPERFGLRHGFLTRESNNTLTIKVAKESDDPFAEGWLRKRGYWVKPTGHNLNLRSTAGSNLETEEHVRHIRRPDGQSVCFLLNTDKGWVPDTKTNACLYAAHLLGSKSAGDMFVASTIMRPWTQVTVPFMEEYPGERQWNRSAPQLRCVPLDGVTDEQWEKWRAMLNRLGRHLDCVIGRLDWCKECGITCGGDYLIVWLAWMIRRPAVKLPFLFFYGGFGGGKSTLLEAISKYIIQGGIVSATNALMTQFNGEFENAVLAVVEEDDISGDSKAANKLKLYTTAQEITIHAKGQTPYVAPSYLHFIQFGNDMGNCPIPPGDQRVTMIEVDPLTEDEIDHRIHDRLAEQAAAFTRVLLDWPLIRPDGHRLSLPVITTDGKLESMLDAAGPMIRSVVEMMDRQTEWKGTAFDLFDTLDAEFEVGKTKRNAKSIRSKLKKASQLFPLCGLDVDVSDDHTEKGNMIYIRKMKSKDEPGSKALAL